TLPRAVTWLHRVRQGRVPAGRPSPLTCLVEATRAPFLDWANARPEQCAAPPVGPPPDRRSAPVRAAGRPRVQACLGAGLVGTRRDADGAYGPGDSPAVRPDLRGLRQPADGPV